MKKIYYEKKGRKYIPVAEYDSDYLDSFPKGYHLVSVYPGGSSRKFRINPAYAPMIAAGRVAEDAICEVIRKASDLRPSKTTITEGQRQAWKKLSEEFGEDNHMLQWPSAREACEAGIKAMQKEAEKLLQKPAVRRAYEQFMLVCELSKTQEDMNVDAS